MSIYKLSFKTADDKIINLPAVINKFTDTNTLKNFAHEHGYDTSQWNCDHGYCLKQLFRHATLRALKIEHPLQTIDWSPLMQALVKEQALFSLPWDVFEKRIEESTLHAILDGNNNLISTISILPKFTKNVRAKLDIGDLNPMSQVYEIGGGWMAHPYRGLNLYTTFRRTVLNKGGFDQSLIFSQARGKGASHVNVKDGWTLIDPERLPFASALMGWPTGDGFIGQDFQLASGIKISLPRRGIYQDPAVSFTLQDRLLPQDAQKFLEGHAWEKFYHLWTNNLIKAIELDIQLREALGILEEENVTSEIIQHTYRRWLVTIEKSLFYQKSKELADDESTISLISKKEWGECINESKNNTSGARVNSI